MHLRAGWQVAFSSFRMFALGAPAGPPRDFGCGGAASEQRTCLLRQARPEERGPLAASCGEAEAVRASVRAPVASVGLNQLLDRVGEVAGLARPAALAERAAASTPATGRRLLQSGGGQQATRSSQVAVSLGYGPPAMLAAIKLWEAVEDGAPSAGLIHGVTLDGTDEAVNPGAGAGAAGVWTRVLAGEAPYEHACAFSPAVLAFAAGGGGRPVARAFDLQRGAWGDPVPEPAPEPEPETGRGAQAPGPPAYACLEPFVFVFGGVPAGSSALRVYDSLGASWAVLNVTGDAPAPRSGATLVPLSGTALLLAGGEGGEGGALSDVWLLDLASLAWTRAAAAAPFTAPARAGAASSAQRPGAPFFYTFGGVSRSGSESGSARYFNDLFRVRADAEGLARPSRAAEALRAAAGEPPSPRAFAALQVFVTGGVGPAEAPVDPSALFVYDLALASWTRLAPAGAGPAPGARAAFLYQGDLHVLGPGGLSGWASGRLPSYPPALANMRATAPYFPAPRAADLPAQVLYPTAGTVLVAGGPIRASWASDAALFDSASVTAFPVDGSMGPVEVCSGANGGACLAALPRFSPPGLYQVVVSLSGRAAGPLLLESELFSVVAGESARVLETVAPAVALSAPALAAGGPVLAGAALRLEWTTRGLPPPHAVAVDLLDASAGSFVQRVANGTRSTSSGSLVWTVDVDVAAAAPLFLRLTVASSSAGGASASAESDAFTVAPYSVWVEGPTAESSWQPGEERPLTVASSNPTPGAATSLARLSLLRFPDASPAAPVAPLLRLSASGGNATVEVRRRRSLLAPASGPGPGAARTLFGDFIWRLPDSLKAGLYVLQAPPSSFLSSATQPSASALVHAQAEIPSDAVVGQTDPFCIGGSCEPGFVFRAPAPLLGTVEQPKLYVGRPYTIRWASAGVPRSAMVQVTITNVAVGKPMPVCVRENSGSFTFTPAPSLGTGLFFFEISAQAAGRPVRSASTEVLLEAFSRAVVPAAYLVVRLPDGRTGYSVGARVPIRWDFANVAALAASIRLVDSAGRLRTIAEAAPNTGSYAYTVGPEVPAGEYSVEVAVGGGALSSTSRSFAVANPARPRLDVGPVPVLLPGQQFRITWRASGIAWEDADGAAGADVALVAAESSALVEVIARGVVEESVDWAVPGQLAPGRYRVEVALAGVRNQSAAFELKPPPPEPDPCLNRPPTAVASVSDPVGKIGPARELAMEMGRVEVLLDSAGSAACDGTPVASRAWEEVSASDSRRPAVIASPSAAATAARRLRVGRTAFRLTVRDRLGQSASALVSVQLTGRKTVLALLCTDAGAAAVAASFNATVAAGALAAGFGAFLGQPLAPASFGDVRAVPCGGDGGFGAVSAKVPAVPGMTGAEVADQLSRLTADEFRRLAGTGGARRGRCLLQFTLRMGRVTNIAVSVQAVGENEPPGVPVLAIVPRSKFNYIIVDRRTKIGTATVEAIAADPAPGVIQAYEWYLDGVQQSSATATVRLDGLRPGNYTVHAIALDDENLYSQSETLTLHVVDEYSCNVAKDLVFAIDTAALQSSFSTIVGFFAQLLRPFWLQGPETYASVVAYSLAPDGNASIAIARAEAKAVYDALLAGRLHATLQGLDATAPRLVGRALEVARGAAEAGARRGVVRSIVLAAFDEPLDADRARNASAAARRRSNVYAVPAVADGYAFGGGFGLFRELVTPDNATNAIPVTLELRDEVERAAVSLAQIVCEGLAPPGADDEAIGERVAQAIAAAVAVSVGASVAASAAGGATFGAGGVLGQAQFAAKTQFLDMELPAGYNATAASVDWSLFYWGQWWRRGESPSGIPRFLLRLFGTDPDQWAITRDAAYASPLAAPGGARGPAPGRRRLLQEAVSGEDGMLYLQQNLVWTSFLIALVSVAAFVVTRFFRRRSAKRRGLPRILTPPPSPPNRGLCLTAAPEQGFAIAAIVSARANGDARTYATALLAVFAGLFTALIAAVLVARIDHERHDRERDVEELRRALDFATVAAGRARWRRTARDVIAARRPAGTNSAAALPPREGTSAAAAGPAGRAYPERSEAGVGGTRPASLANLVTSAQSSFKFAKGSPRVPATVQEAGALQATAGELESAGPGQDGRSRLPPKLKRSDDEADGEPSDLEVLELPPEARRGGGGGGGAGVVVGGPSAAAAEHGQRAHRRNSKGAAPKPPAPAPAKTAPTSNAPPPTDAKPAVGLWRLRIKLINTWVNFESGVWVVDPVAKRRAKAAGRGRSGPGLGSGADGDADDPKATLKAEAPGAPVPGAAGAGAGASGGGRRRFTERLFAWWPADHFFWRALRALAPRPPRARSPRALTGAAAPRRAIPAGKWYGIWDLVRKTLSCLIVVLVADPHPEETPAGSRRAALYVIVQLLLMLALNTAELLYVIRTAPFREWVENGVQGALLLFQNALLALLLLVAWDPQTPALRQCSLAASFLSASSVGLAVANQIRAERRLLAVAAARVGRILRHLFRLVTCRPCRAFGRVHAEELEPARPGVAEAALEARSRSRAAAAAGEGNEGAGRAGSPAVLVHPLSVSRSADDDARGSFGPHSAVAVLGGGAAPSLLATGVGAAAVGFAAARAFDQWEGREEGEGGEEVDLEGGDGDGEEFGGDAGLDELDL
eukprot:tig00021717_g23138.t1